MHEQFLVQKKLQYYITYVKNLLIGLAEEFQTERVHYRRIIPVIDRLFSNENKEFLSFFNGKKNRESWQLLQLMHQQGEILNEGKGYYSLLPTRIIQFPKGETNVLVSGYDYMSNESYYGLSQLAINQQIIYPVLKPDDYAYRPVLLGIMSILEKKLSLLNLDISEAVRFISGRQLKTSLVTNIKEGEWFIAIHETLFNSKDFYVALKKDNTIYGTYILKQNYLRTCFALCDFYGIENKYTVSPLKDELVEIYFNRRLPKEELSLLNLIALPSCYDNPKRFITHELQLDNIQLILENLKLKEMK